MNIPERETKILNIEQNKDKKDGKKNKRPTGSGKQRAQGKG